MSTKNDILWICGLPRCGSSMTMQMLAAGGVPVTGQEPAYEYGPVCRLPGDTGWMQDVRGKAVKLLDPHQNRPPADTADQCIWLDRDLRQQTRSQAKFTAAVQGVEMSKSDIKRLYRLNRRERRSAIEVISRQVGELHRFSFGDTLETPEHKAIRLSEVVEAVLGVELDVEAAADAVEERSSKCANGLRRELRMVGGGLQ